MTKVRGNALVRLMITLVKSSIQWRTRWLDLVSWPTVFTLGLRPYEINHSSMNAKAKKNNNNNILTFSTKRFQTPTESQYAKARRKRKDSEGTHMCQVQTLIGWQQSPLGHQNLTRLFISSNISVVAIGSNQSLRGIYITSGYGSHRLFEARPRIFLPIAQSCAALLCCRLAILESSLEWLVGDHDPQPVFYVFLVLRDFIVSTLLLSFQTCLILKSVLLLLIHSRSFFASSPSLFYRYWLLGHFFTLFSWKKARNLHLLLLSCLIDYNKVPMRNLIG